MAAECETAAAAAAAEAAIAGASAAQAAAAALALAAVVTGVSCSGGGCSRGAGGSGKFQISKVRIPGAANGNMETGSGSGGLSFDGNGGVIGSVVGIVSGCGHSGGAAAEAGCG